MKYSLSTMKELREFLTTVLTVKIELKESYYTSRGSPKDDAKQLVQAIISIQKCIEELMKLRRKSKGARKILADKKATLSLKKWNVGLPKRVKDYTQKSKKLSGEHLHRYFESFQKYVTEIVEELACWVIDIEYLDELPKPPKD